MALIMKKESCMNQQAVYRYLTVLQSELKSKVEKITAYGYSSATVRKKHESIKENLQWKKLLSF